MLKYLLFDVDDTLYHPSAGVWPAIGERINQYMIERLHIPPAEVGARRAHYFQVFGTSLNGLMREYDVDRLDFLKFVHDFPLEHHLQPDPALRGMLARLPLTKVLFTNADAAHARRVTQALGVERFFSRTIDIVALDFVNKPDPQAYTKALALLGAQAAECLFADDQTRNLRPAREAGLITVLVSETDSPIGVDYHIHNILGLERIVAGLLGQQW